MALLSDFVVIGDRDEDVSAVLADPDRAVMRFPSRRIDPDRLDALERAIVGRPNARPEPLGLLDDGEVFVLPVSRDATERLAAAEPEHLDRWATAWGPAADLREDARAVIAAVVPLARRALDPGLRLALWCCV